MDDFRKTIVDVAIMANSFDDAGPLNAYYVAKAFVSAKVNGTNNWALEVLEVVAPFGFTTNPTITLTQTFSNQATMTIDGTFGGGDDTGVVCCLIPQPFSLVEFPT